MTAPSSSSRLGFPADPEDRYIIALVKGSERYVFLFDDASYSEVLRIFGRFASEEELSFTWFDAAVLSQKVRQETKGQDL